MEKVSIIVPNYNHEKYLKQRLDSIFDQTYRNFEVILLDDASPDNSVEILKKYKDHPQVSHFLVNSKNTGSPFKQWGKGVSLARGKYIWIAESDDWADKRFLEVLIRSFQPNSNLGMAHCALNWVDAKGNPMTNRTYHRESFRRSGISEIKEHLVVSNSIQNVSAVLFDREVFRDIHLEDYSKYKMCGDWMLYVSILKKWDVEFVNFPLCFFRRHRESTSIDGYKSGIWLEEGSDVFDYFDIRRQMNFSEYRIVVQTWLLKSRKLSKKLKWNIAGKIISKVPFYLRWFFWSFFFRIQFK